MSSGQASKWLWAAVAWTGVIFFSSTSLASKWAEATFRFLSGEFLSKLRPDSSSYGVLHLLADKGFHVSLFLVLAILLWLALARSESKVWLILAAGLVVGSCSEFLQRFFPDRDPAIRDVLINVGGTAVGLLLCLASSRFTGRRNREPARVGIG